MVTPLEFFGLMAAGGLFVVGAVVAFLLLWATPPEAGGDR